MVMSGGRTMVKVGASPVNPGADWQARRYADQGYRPLDPERFPWRCEASPEAESCALAGDGPLLQIRCVLVDGHDGEHRGEVSWS